MLGGDETARRIGGVEAGCSGCRSLRGHRVQRERVLGLDGIPAHHFDHLEVQPTVIVDQAAEAHHATARPHFVSRTVGVRPPGEQQVDLSPDHWIGEQREDGTIARLVLVGVEPLARESFRSVHAHRAQSTRLLLPGDDVNGRVPARQSQRGAARPAERRRWRGGST